MTASHELPERQNPVEYTVALTFRVQGGAGWQTAYRRAERIAERLTNYATGAAHVVEVHATGGPSTGGEIVARDRVRFSEANTGRGIGGDGPEIDRWVAPEFVDSLARSDADRERREAVGCSNSHRSDYEIRRACACVYCTAGRKPETRTGLASAPQSLTPRCPCGTPTGGWHQRCLRHRNNDVVVLDGDPADLARLAELLQRERRRPDPALPTATAGTTRPRRLGAAPDQPRNQKEEPMSDYTIRLDWPAADLLAYALQRTMDDLEARAIVAEHHDAELGPASAAEYRSDIRRLRGVLDQVSPGVRPPDPEQAAVRWLDGTYTVADGEPVAMVSRPHAREILEAAIALLDTGRLSPDRARDLLETALERGRANGWPVPSPEATTRQAPSRQLDRDLDPPASR